MKLTRIDYIGQNGPDGAIYEEIKDMSDSMSDEKWEEEYTINYTPTIGVSKNSPYKTPEETFEAMDKEEIKEKVYLTKLIDDHWAYVKELIIAHGNELDICIAEFHYKSAFRHGFKHAFEYVEENK